ncbi:MAG: DNA-binding protein [Candidatus Schekmanbacteria bacterium RBG_13_48_7]|uniref:Ribonuclease VapC n=1 Tax=Candidatus Schekmanbacteria bacterium RBG_13_48_7 TaxID=1817878 RepID=A0A1F7S1E8_9BACT|nr:MAG: DNA-binding protein [Candidatus Schekmanbacteria bacterium RBG_13_48_7]
MIVVDVNIIIYLFIQGERTQQARALLFKDAEWSAPILWKSEFLNVLATHVRKNIIPIHVAMILVQIAEVLMKGKEYIVQASEVLILAKNSGCSAYDCEYVVLAKDFNIPLLTTDKKVLSSFPSIAISPEAYLQQT